MSALNTTRLRDLISAVRQCKTIAEERALIKRESAIIREAFQENRSFFRTRNMLKLLYISMLGYPTEFGQVEVLRLLAQPAFVGKRVGYLTLQTVLDENDEVLTLSENHIKKDLTQGLPLVQSIALNAVANIASEVIARDVFGEINKLLCSSNSYLSKKASLAALRIVKKAPEYAEVFLESIQNMFHECHLDSLLAVVTLASECLQLPQGQPFIAKFRLQANTAVHVLKQLVLASQSTERDILGICDPFLQVKILEFMRIIGKDSAVISEILNDVLAQVLTNTDSSRNIGCAVQYECVKTIYAIESDEALRTLGINAVSRFLSSNDNNLRFVALQCLLGYASRNLEAVCVHQDVIMDCLEDVDISVCQRALELIVAIVNEQNVRLLVPDLISYLTVCAEEIQKSVTLHLCSLVEEKSPNVDWRVEYSLSILRLSGQHVPLDFATRFIVLISNESRELQKSVVVAVWQEVSCRFDHLQLSREAFLVAAVWSIGEYVDLLFEEKGLKEEDVASFVADVTTKTKLEVLICYGMTALMKIASRYPDTKQIALNVYANYATSFYCEVQQRACEYTTLLESFADEAAFCFARMPPIRRQVVEGAAGPEPPGAAGTSFADPTKQPAAVALDDLFDVGVTGQPTSETTTGAGVAKNNVHDDSRGAGSGTIEDLFAPKPDVTSGQNANPTPAGSAVFGEVIMPAEVRVFECDDFVVDLAATARDFIHAKVTIFSCIPTAMESLSIQAAVPKTATLTIASEPPTLIQPHSRVVQEFIVDSSKCPGGPRHLMLRIKLFYTVGGVAKSQLFQILREL